MKTKKLFLLAALIAGLNLLAAGRVTAQTFTTLHSFTASATNGSGVYTNSDGANPYAGLTVAADGKTRYGTTANGGSGGWGTVFAINADGTGFTNLHSFNYSDGANPWAGLVLSGHTLYGTAYNGGSSGAGTVFAINTDGTGFMNLHSFTPAVDRRCMPDLACPDGYTCTDNLDGIAVCSSSNGAYPNAGLILSGNTLYGTASQGGYYRLGMVFAVNTDGTGFTNLHSFFGGDGANPRAGLILSGNTLYGTAAGGGSWGSGTVFAVNTDGTGFTVLHNFTQEIVPCLNGSCPPGSHCVGGVCVPIVVGGCPGGCGGGQCVCLGDRDGNPIGDCYCAGRPPGCGP